VSETTTTKTTKHDEFSNERKEAFKAIYGVEKISEILELFEVDYKEMIKPKKGRDLSDFLILYKKYSYAIFFRYSASAIRNNLNKFKNIIKDAKNATNEANALSAFTVDEVFIPLRVKDVEVKKEIKANIQDGTNDKLDVNEHIAKINELKEILTNRTYKVARNQDKEQVRAYFLYAILALSTGRRFTEIMKTFSMNKKGKKLTFEGLLKGHGTIEGNIIELTYQEANAYLKELRAYAKSENMTEDEVNKKYSRVFNNAMDRLFGFKNAHDLRHHYSMAGNQIFSREGESELDTTIRILGHKESLSGALNYLTKGKKAKQSN